MQSIELSLLMQNAGRGRQTGLERGWGAGESSNGRALGAMTPKDLVGAQVPVLWSRISLQTRALDKRVALCGQL